MKTSELAEEKQELKEQSKILAKKKHRKEKTSQATTPKSQQKEQHKTMQFIDRHACSERGDIDFSGEDAPEFVLSVEVMLQDDKRTRKNY